MPMKLIIVVSLINADQLILMMLTTIMNDDNKQEGAQLQGRVAHWDCIRQELSGRGDILGEMFGANYPGRNFGELFGGFVRGGIRIPMQDYKSLRAAVMICATASLVINTHRICVHTQTHMTAFHRLYYQLSQLR